MTYTHKTTITSSLGVFVITHIDSCRNGGGYCILGYTCEVDKDFVADDLGGHCRGLSKAFNPKASFVCCRENPKTKEPNKSPVDLQHIIDAGYSESEDAVPQLRFLNCLLLKHMFLKLIFVGTNNYLF